MNPKFQGTPVKLVGTLNVGDHAPVVKLKTKDLAVFEVGGKKDKVQLINVVPSLDTPVCVKQAKEFNAKASSLSNVEVSVVSLDLPFAQGRFCSTEGVSNLHVLSDFVNKEFGQKYGVLIGDSPLEGLLTRAVFVVGTCGKVLYKQVCEEITNEPNYQEILEFVKNI